MTVGFAMCGSFCTYDRIFPVIEALSKIHSVIPILSQTAYETDCRFGTAGARLQRLEAICGIPPLHLVTQVEPIGPKCLLDALIIAPCTGNTLAKLAYSIADSSVTMAANSQLRNARPVVIAVSTNDGLAGAAENIGRLFARKHCYFVPFGQDDPVRKPTSLVADFSKIPQTLEAALGGRQLQPLLL